MAENERSTESGKRHSTIAVCLVCRNEADRLSAALDSVRWADEIVVMDLESSDGSADLARKIGAKVITHQPVPIVEMVRHVLESHVSAEWILVLDPDERIRPALAKALRDAAGKGQVDAVIIPRMNYDLGYPPSNPRERYEPQLRMYRRSAISWPTTPNAQPKVPEERKLFIPAHDDLVMEHDRSRNIPEVVDRIARYATLQAQSMIDSGETFTARKMVTALGTRLYRQLIAGQAWRDGVPGLLRVGILVGFHFYIWAAFWQLSGAKRTPEDDRYVRRIGVALEGIRRSISVAEFPGKIWRLVRRR